MADGAPYQLPEGDEERPVSVPIGACHRLGGDPIRRFLRGLFGTGKSEVTVREFNRAILAEFALETDQRLLTLKAALKVTVLVSLLPSTTTYHIANQANFAGTVQQGAVAVIESPANITNTATNAAALFDAMLNELRAGSSADVLESVRQPSMSAWYDAAQRNRADAR